MAAFQYNYAIVCRIPTSLRDHSIRVKSSKQAVNLAKAREEHRNLIETLKACSVNIIEIESDENYPDCTFVEDCAVVIGGSALITRPGDRSRQGEVAEIRRVLKKDLALSVVDIDDPTATVDGGDVLFTGKEIIVGLSTRTNVSGASAVAAAFPDYTTTVIDVKGPCHLKSYANMAGRDIIAVGKSKDAQDILMEIKAKAFYAYYMMELEDEAAANILYVNGRLIHRTRNEIKESYVIFDEKIGYTRHDLELIELSRGTANLSSLVLLFSKTRFQKELISTIGDADICPFAYLKTD